MRDLSALEATYNAVDAWLEGERLSAPGDQARTAQIELRQRLNDQAYFVICWGQLESAISDACRYVIRQGSGHSEWRTRRAWYLYNPDDKRLSGLSFEDRTALVLDRSGGKGGPYARVMHYYALRNQIAHGALRSERIDISEVVAEFYQIQSAIVR